MKKYFVLPMLLLLLASCGKSVTLISRPGSWTVGSNTTAAFEAVGSTSRNILFADNTFPPDPDTVFFYFNTYPTASGNYAIVNSETPASGQVGMLLKMGLAATTYVPAASSAALSAAVSVSGGKVSIHVPVMEVQTIGNPGDTIEFIANINQTL